MRTLKFIICLSTILSMQIEAQEDSKTNNEVNANVCELSFKPKIRIQNNSNLEIESLNFKVVADGQMAEDVPWTGTLGAGNAALLELPKRFVHQGIHTVQVYLDKVDQMDDLDDVDIRWANSFDYPGCAEKASFVWDIQTNKQSQGESSTAAFKESGKELTVQSGGENLTCPNCLKETNAPELNLWTQLYFSDRQVPETNISFDRGANWTKAYWIPGELEVAEDSVVYLATMEQEFAGFEEALFNNIPKTRVVFDDANITQAKEINSNEVTRIGGDFGVMGPSKFLKIEENESLKAEVLVYAETEDINDEIIPALLPAVLGSASSSMMNLEGTMNNVITASPNSALISAFISEREQSASGASINYIIFNDKLDFVDAGFQSLTSPLNREHKTLTIPKLEFQSGGYIYVFLSNSQKSVAYFDDFRITHYTSKND